jgi:hypothetical protein
MRAGSPVNLLHPGAEPFEPASLHVDRFAQFDDSSNQGLAPFQRPPPAELHSLPQLFGWQLPNLMDGSAQSREFRRDPREPFFVDRVDHGKRTP